MASTSEQYIFGLKIQLETRVAQDTTIGLYTQDFGDATTEFTITNAAGSVTYNRTAGTMPNFDSNGVKSGDLIIINLQGAEFDADNNGVFEVTGFAEGFVVVRNPVGANKVTVIGAGKVSNCQFRFVQTTHANFELVWKAGLIVRDGFQNLSSASDFRWGGNLVQYKGLNVVVANTLENGTDKFWKKLDNAVISLNGLRADIIELDVSTNPATETAIYRGVAEAPPSWTETTFTIPIMSQFYKRQSNLSTQIDNSINGNRLNAEAINNGKIIPITVGEILKAKFLRTASAIFPLITTDAGLDLGATIVMFATSSESGTQIFPVIEDGGDTPPKQYKIQLGTSVGWTVGGVPKTTGTITLASLVGQYIHVIDGTGSGAYRQITQAFIFLETSVGSVPGSNILLATVADYFEETLEHAGADQSWVQIEDIEREYEADVWDCKNYIDSSGNVVTQALELYSYIEEKSVVIPSDAPAVDTRTPIDEQIIQYRRLPEYAYDDATSGTGNNKIEIDVKLFNASPDKMDSFVILPVRNIQALASMSPWNVPDSSPLSWVLVQDGIFRASIDTVNPIPTLPVPANFDDLIDKDKSTSEQFAYSIASNNNTHRILNALSFELPVYPTGLDYDTVYVLFRGTQEVVKTGGAGNVSTVYKFQLGWRRFVATDHLIIENQVGSASADIEVDSTPDFYYDPQADTRNLNFYVSNIAGNDLLAGFTNLEIAGVDTEEKYNSIFELGLFMEYDHTTGGPGVVIFLSETSFYELAVAFKKEISIKQELYSPIRGRIFDDTFGGRKTAANMMENPIDVIEHILRLQDWSEMGGKGTNWGKEYAPNPKINTGSSAEGGLDYAELDPVKGFKCTRQILSYNDAWSDKMIKSLCRQYFLCSFQTDDGKENISTIGRLDTTPTVALTLADVIPGSLQNVREPSTEDIFVEPFVRYNFNNARKSFDNIIRITNTSKDTYEIGFVTGYTGGDAEVIWDRAHKLWQHYRVIEEPPTEMTDAVWIKEDEDAKQYLLNWLDWMGVYEKEDVGLVVAPKRRITFSVSYKTATTISALRKRWFVSMHFNLTLPFQTNAVTVQCMIEAINFDLNKGVANVTAILLDDTSAVVYFIKDSYDSHASVGWDDWKDSLLTQAEAPSQENDIKDKT